MLITFGSLINIYNSLTDLVDLACVSPIIENLEERWDRFDQIVLISSVILNPLYLTALLCPSAVFTAGGISALLSEAWMHLFGRPAPTTLFGETMLYLHFEGIFGYLHHWVAESKDTISLGTMVRSTIHY